VYGLARSNRLALIKGRRVGLAARVRSNNPLLNTRTFAPVWRVLPTVTPESINHLCLFDRQGCERRRPTRSVHRQHWQRTICYTVFNRRNADCVRTASETLLWEIFLRLLTSILSVIA